MVVSGQFDAGLAGELLKRSINEASPFDEPLMIVPAEEARMGNGLCTESARSADPG